MVHFQCRDFIQDSLLGGLYPDNVMYTKYTLILNSALYIMLIIGCTKPHKKICIATLAVPYIIYIICIATPAVPYIICTCV